jgi:site-specific DNA-methyltransferase (adenine-specific)
VTAPTFRLAQGDAVAWLRAQPSESLDMVVTDPPYESLEEHRAVGTTTRLKHSKASSNDWFEIFPNARFGELMAELYRVLKRGASLYMYCDPKTLFVAKPAADAAGFKFRNTLVWDKLAIGMGYSYRRRYENILFLSKGKGPQLTDRGLADVIRSKRIANGYPTEKPVEVSEILVRQSSQPGQLIGDPFMGSGSAGVAAARLGRCFTGNDLCAEAVEVTRTRLVEAHAIEVIEPAAAGGRSDELQLGLFAALSPIAPPALLVPESNVRVKVPPCEECGRRNYHLLSCSRVALGTELELGLEEVCG